MVGVQADKQRALKTKPRTLGTRARRTLHPGGWLGVAEGAGKEEAFGNGEDRTPRRRTSCLRTAMQTEEAGGLVSEGFLLLKFSS
jgi:hypothetical protein